MADPIEERLYLSRRRHEVRALRMRAQTIEDELTAALSDPGATIPMSPLRSSQWSAARREKLDTWLFDRRDQLDHIDVELFVYAFTPPPPVWFVVWPPPLFPWWRGLWPWAWPW